MLTRVDRTVLHARCQGSRNTRPTICRSTGDATRGAFLASLCSGFEAVGGTSLSHFQASYRRYYKMPALRGTVFAGDRNLGLANLFNPRDETLREP